MENKHVIGTPERNDSIREFTRFEERGVCATNSVNIGNACRRSDVKSPDIGRIKVVQEFDGSSHLVESSPKGDVTIRNIVAAVGNVGCGTEPDVDLTKRDFEIDVDGLGGLDGTGKSPKLGCVCELICQGSLDNKSDWIGGRVALGIGSYDQLYLLYDNGKLSGQSNVDVSLAGAERGAGVMENKDVGASEGVDSI